MAGTSWWQAAVIYQIYPRSFQDTNRDGVGDIQGIIRRLPHLVELGIDAIWISPIFPSPMSDFGYDISSYFDIDPVFGSLRDFDELMSAARRHGLKLLLDLVPNHTSDRHPWFIASRTSRESSKRDWYIWRDPEPEGGPPNNWLSQFGGSAWAARSPDGAVLLPRISQPAAGSQLAQLRSAKRHLRRDAILVRSEASTGFGSMFFGISSRTTNFATTRPMRISRLSNRHTKPCSLLYTADRPEIDEVVREMRARGRGNFPIVCSSARIYLPVERLVAYYGRDLDGAHLPFNFALLKAPWHARAIAQLIDRYEALLPPGGWPNWVLGNHDVPRLRQPHRAGTGRHRGDASADVARHSDDLLRRGNRDAAGSHCRRSGAGTVSEERA